ncbi:MAG: tRNA uridine-5-carboxymethylaminomethyl(34) synthesis GTPase MnmE [Rhizobiales bacterium]|nr:tRNA uridine-5-carboxymethylaminomethyl(34) synthesis GTPase MnmE [Hyphomicrobiales bacterium]
MTDPRPDTIFALSSGRPPAAIAVVRISGPRAGDALQALIGRIPAPRRAALARVRDPWSGEMIDEALALWFPGPASETGEDVAELQLHGGRAVIAAVLAALGRVEGLRPAEAGEFTRRAFANGRLDLTAVEGLADLIGAETEAQRRQAYRQLKGLLGDRAEGWRRRLIKALALVEAGIDFSDEGDVPATLMEEARAATRRLLEEILVVLADGRRGERLRDGMVVAIAGPPNAGKSTLLNRLARREAAIVSPYAGTTRDVIEVHLDLDGYPVTLLDTAGVRDTGDPVEMEGVNRARARAAEADLVLWVVDAASGCPVSGPEADGSVWLVRNKTDLLDDSGEERAPGRRNELEKARKKQYFVHCFDISASEGRGVDSLIKALADAASGHIDAEPALITRARHRMALAETSEALGRALQQTDDDLVAEELRLATRALGRLTGRVDVEDILDVIFRDFCIGK